jgi:hypothetical protein
MITPECIIQKSKNILPFDAWDSFEGTPHSPDSSKYLDKEHRAQLIEHSQLTEIKEHPHEEYVAGVGLIKRAGYITKNGYAYSALIGIPETQKCDVPVIGTSAWTTSTEGHNEHTVRNFMRQGNFIIFVGAEGSYEPKNSPTPAGPITLADSAASILNYSNHVAQDLVEQGYDIDPTNRLLIGESRGAMVGMGVIALANDFNQNILASDLAAPCLPRKLQLSDIRNLTEQISKEPIELFKLAGKLTLSRLIHYPSTLDLSPYSLKHQFAIGFALFSGEAGAMARHIPNEALLHITVFNNDIASMHSDWQKIFQNHPNVRITPLPGGHMSIADPETLSYTLARNATSQLCINNNGELNQESVFDAAHSLIPRISKLPRAS